MIVKVEKTVDILLATYNGAKYLSQQLDSLFAQNFQDWQIIIHDDGSSDGTVQIVEEYERRYPDKIKFIKDGIRTGGAKDNFAHLMKFASADYVMFCDQDDVWLPEKIDDTFRLMLETESEYPNKPVLVHSDLKVVDSDLNSLATSMFEFQRLSKQVNLSDSFVQNNVTGCTVMINRMALDIALPIPNEAIMHDWWLVLKVLTNSGHVAFLDKPTLLYRQHESNSVGAQKVSFLYFLSKLSQAYKVIGAIYRQANLIKPQSFFLIILKKGMLVLGRSF